MNGPEYQYSGCQSLRETAAVALLSRRSMSPETHGHLELCPPCRFEIAQLAAVVPLLSASKAGAVAPTVVPSDLLLPRLLAEVARRRRRRRLAGVARSR